VTLFMTLLAAFQVLLSRYSGQSDISVGTPIAGRNRLETEGLIGFFVNTLVLRTDLSGAPSFRELLGRVREVALGADAHQEVPFEKLVEELQPARSLSHTPLFQVMLVLQNTPVTEVQLEGLRIGGWESETATAKFDLTLALTEDAAGVLSGSLQYNRELFEAGTMQRMLGHFEMLLESFVREPEQRITGVELLSGAERAQVLGQWNETGRDYPEANRLQELFEGQAEQQPEAMALVSEAEQLSYGALNSRANQLAHYLQQQGVGAEQRVGIYQQRTAALVVSLLAVLKAGGVYVPLDPDYPAERLNFMLADAEVKVLLTESGLAARLGPSAVRQICVDEQWEEIARESIQQPVAKLQRENLAYVIYTSGSTGQPKGVAIEHQSALNLMHWAKEAFSREQLQGVLAATSICFDLSVFELFVPLSWGGQVILAENALQLPELRAREQVTLVNTVPSAMTELVRLKAVPKSVQVVNLAGEALSLKLVQQVYEQQPGVSQLYNLYGPSEDTTYSTGALVDAAAEQVLIGRPLANRQAYILDAHYQPVPVGVAGELYLGGAGLARGYLQRPDLTAEKFIPHPFSAAAGARLYRTGDVTRYRSNGEIEYLGRSDQQIKLRGYRIELGEIEAVIKQQPGVSEAAVVVREDSRGEKWLAAYVIREKPGAQQ